MSTNIIEQYIPLVKFIAQTCGEHFEVILHDLRKIGQTIIAIENNHLTGRALGDSITNFALQIIQEQQHTQNDYLVNYLGSSDDGKKQFRSSTYFIKDTSGDLIGMLCINVDITALEQTRSFLDSLLATFSPTPTPLNNETFDMPMYDIMKLHVDQTLTHINIPVSRMLPDEKRSIIYELNEKGVFLIKGGIAYVAGILEVSEQSIYRYLKESTKQPTT